MSVFGAMSGAPRAQGDPRSGSIYGYHATNTAPTQTANVLTLWPVWIERPVPIDRLAFWTGSAVVGTAKTALFSALPSGAPGSLIAESNADVSTNAVGLQLCTLAANSTPPAGWNWLGICFSAASNAYASSGAGVAAVDWLMQWGNPSAHPAGANPRIFMTAALTYVAGPAPFMPASVGAVTYTDAIGATPVLGWRAA